MSETRLRPRTEHDLERLRLTIAEEFGVEWRGPLRYHGGRPSRRHLEGGGWAWYATGQNGGIRLAGRDSLRATVSAGPLLRSSYDHREDLLTVWVDDSPLGTVQPPQ